jgi:peptidoglycan/LPS O-acetylase OafA/YrhL
VSRHHAPLDGLRAVAVLFVVAAHVGFLRGGTLGVDLFFVLSGFLITTLLLEEHEARGAVSLLGFYTRRAFRLFPALWLLLSAYLAFGLASGRIGSPRHLLGAAAVGLGYLENLFLAGSSGVPAHYLWHLWSLAEEEQFYLLWPIVLGYCLRRKVTARDICLILAGLLVAVNVDRLALFFSGAGSARIWFGPDTHSDGLILGCLAALACARGRTITRSAAAVGACVALALVAIPSVKPLSDAVLLTVTAPAFPVGCALVIWHAWSNSSAKVWRALSIRPLTYLGRISYGIYLWHFPLMHAMRIAPGLIMTVVVAAVSHRFVEAPLRRYGRRLIDARSHRLPRVAPEPSPATP